MSIDWSQKYTNHAFYSGMLKSYQSAPVVAQYMADQDVFLCAGHGNKKREDFLWIGDEIKPRTIGTDPGSKDGDYGCELEGFTNDDGKVVVTKAKYST
ncbi:hypothetical protein [Endozoicomonas sp. ALB032]|uniref:hypothetical protein n=1 Tax=Endozoicomonas sp. ALB032 TaxID=3403082 RepID=UPI003BB55430